MKYAAFLYMLQCLKNASHTGGAPILCLRPLDSREIRCDAYGHAVEIAGLGIPLSNILERLSIFKLFSGVTWHTERSLELEKINFSRRTDKRSTSG